MSNLFSKYQHITLDEDNAGSNYETYRGIIFDPETNAFKVVEGKFRDKKDMYEKMVKKGYVLRKCFEKKIFDWIEDNSPNNLIAYLMFSTAFSKWRNNNLLSPYYVKLLNDIPAINREGRKGDPQSRGKKNVSGFGEAFLNELNETLVEKATDKPIDRSNYKDKYNLASDRGLETDANGVETNHKLKVTLVDKNGNPIKSDNVDTSREFKVLTNTSTHRTKRYDDPKFWLALEAAIKGDPYFEEEGFNDARTFTYTPNPEDPEKRIPLEDENLLNKVKEVLDKTAFLNKCNRKLHNLKKVGKEFSPEEYAEWRDAGKKRGELVNEIKPYNIEEDPIYVKVEDFGPVENPSRTGKIVLLRDNKILNLKDFKADMYNKLNNANYLSGSKNINAHNIKFNTEEKKAKTQKAMDDLQSKLDEFKDIQDREIYRFVNNLTDKQKENLAKDYIQKQRNKVNYEINKILPVVEQLKELDAKKKEILADKNLNPETKRNTLSNIERHYSDLVNKYKDYSSSSDEVNNIINSVGNPINRQLKINSKDNTIEIETEDGSYKPYGKIQGDLAYNNTGKFLGLIKNDKLYNHGKEIEYVQEYSPLHGALNYDLNKLETELKNKQEELNGKINVTPMDIDTAVDNHVNKILQNNENAFLSKLDVKAKKDTQEQLDSLKAKNPEINTKLNTMMRMTTNGKVFTSEEDFNRYNELGKIINKENGHKFLMSKNIKNKDDLENYILNAESKLAKMDDTTSEEAQTLKKECAILHKLDKLSEEQLQNKYIDYEPLPENEVNNLRSEYVKLSKEGNKQAAIEYNKLKRDSLNAISPKNPKRGGSSDNAFIGARDLASKYGSELDIFNKTNFGNKGYLNNDQAKKFEHLNNLLNNKEFRDHTSPEVLNQIQITIDQLKDKATKQGAAKNSTIFDKLSPETKKEYDTLKKRIKFFMNQKNNFEKAINQYYKPLTKNKDLLMMSKDQLMWKSPEEINAFKQLRAKYKELLQWAKDNNINLETTKVSTVLDEQNPNGLKAILIDTIDNLNNNISNAHKSLASFIQDHSLDFTNKDVNYTNDDFVKDITSTLNDLAKNNIDTVDEYMKKWNADHEKFLDQYATEKYGSIDNYNQEMKKREDLLKLYKSDRNLEKELNANNQLLKAVDTDEAKEISRQQADIANILKEIEAIEKHMFGVLEDNRISEEDQLKEQNKCLKEIEQKQEQIKAIEKQIEEYSFDNEIQREELNKTKDELNNKKNKVKDDINNLNPKEEAVHVNYGVNTLDNDEKYGDNVFFEDNNKTLNDKLFDNTNDQLYPDVKEALLKVADTFKQHLDVPFEPVDIYFTGSNANYNYNDQSDIDLHLVFDFENAGMNAEMLSKYMKEAKTVFNSRYDIKVKGIPVEVGCENIAEPLVTSGVYSVLNDCWKVQPSNTCPTDASFEQAQYDEITNEIEDAIETHDSSTIEALWKMLGALRKDSLASEGEYGKGNLLFKKLRNMDYLKRLKDAYYNSASRELSLEAWDNDLEDTDISNENKSSEGYMKEISKNKQPRLRDVYNKALKQLSENDDDDEGKKYLKTNRLWSKYKKDHDYFYKPYNPRALYPNYDEFKAWSELGINPDLIKGKVFVKDDNFIQILGIGPKTIAYVILNPMNLYEPANENAIQEEDINSFLNSIKTKDNKSLLAFINHKSNKFLKSKNSKTFNTILDKAMADEETAKENFCNEEVKYEGKIYKIRDLLPRRLSDELYGIKKFSHENTQAVFDDKITSPKYQNGLLLNKKPNYTMSDDKLLDTNGNIVANLYGNKYYINSKGKIIAYKDGDELKTLNTESLDEARDDTIYTISKNKDAQKIADIFSGKSEEISLPEELTSKFTGEELEWYGFHQNTLIFFHSERGNLRAPELPYQLNALILDKETNEIVDFDLKCLYGLKENPTQKQERAAKLELPPKLFAKALREALDAGSEYKEKVKLAIKDAIKFGGESGVRNAKTIRGLTGNGIKYISKPFTPEEVIKLLNYFENICKQDATQELGKIRVEYFNNQKVIINLYNYFNDGYSEDFNGTKPGKYFLARCYKDILTNHDDLESMKTDPKADLVKAALNALAGAESLGGPGKGQVRVNIKGIGKKREGVDYLTFIMEEITAPNHDRFVPQHHPENTYNNFTQGKA